MGENGDDPVLPPKQVQYLIAALLRSNGRHLDSEIAEDCAVIASITLWAIGGRIGGLPEEARAAYAYRSVQRAVWDYLKVEIRHRSREVGLNGSEPEEVRLPKGATDQDLMEFDGRRRWIERPNLDNALDALSERDREIMRLYYREGLTDQEIADRLEMKRGTVKMRRNRTLDHLRKWIGAGEEPAAEY